MNNRPHTSLTQSELGSLVAEVLTGAWRESAGPKDFSADQLSTVTPLLYSSGCAALAWWRVRHSASSESDAGARLHDAYRQMRLAALVHEREIKYVLSLLRAVDIEPVLVKGWAIARQYPDRALRPYGDIDLCVRPDQFAKASAALKCLESIEGHYVDLHAGFDNIGVGTRRQARLARESHHRDSNATSWDDLFQRSQLVPLSEPGAVATGLVDATGPSFPVRVLCAEDHLRILCLHLLRSGAWRPLWLCDVALLVETRGPEFDWHRCLGRDALYADWVACTLGLAHQLLGVDVSGTPVADRAQSFPRWFSPAVLRQWGRVRRRGSEERAVSSGVSSPTVREGHFQDNSSSAHLGPVNRSVAALRDLYARWDNPVRSTAAVHGQFNNWPRLPYRVAESIMRSRELPKALAQIVRQFAARKKPAAVQPPLNATTLDLTQKLS